MSWSYKVIKNHQIRHSGEKDFHVPIVSIRDSVEKEESTKETFNEEINRIKITELKAQEIMESAIKEKERMLSEAVMECETIKKEAYEASYKNGYEDGKKEGFEEGVRVGFKETEELRVQGKEVLKDAHKRSREYIDKTKEEIIQLAVDIAQNITHYQINQEDENIGRMVNKALQEVKDRKQIILRCHPKNILFLESNFHEFEKTCHNGRIMIIEDQGIDENGCIIESELLVIDLQISRQLENIKRALKEMGNGHDA